MVALVPLPQLRTRHSSPALKSGASWLGMVSRERLNSSGLGFLKKRGGGNMGQGDASVPPPRPHHSRPYAMGGCSPKNLPLRGPLHGLYLLFHLCDVTLLKDEPIL
jgi:hypothetical protein